jgi:hypothetical protein
MTRPTFLILAQVLVSPMNDAHDRYLPPILRSAAFVAVIVRCTALSATRALLGNQINVSASQLQDYLDRH